MHSLTPEVERLLSAAPGQLPLSQAALPQAMESPEIRLQDALTLFPAARNHRAALAGLLLRLGRWEESHNVAQDVESVEGSYWHGILHRIEPDSSNAGYWFRRVGRHAIFPELLQQASQVLEDNRTTEWRPRSTWDPFLFIEWCDEARREGGSLEQTAQKIQMVEWRLLFEWCLNSG